MPNLCLHATFGATRFIGDRDMAKNINPGCHPPLSGILSQVQFWALRDTQVTISMCIPNVMQLFSLATNLWSQNKIQDGGAAILNFQRGLFWAPGNPHMASMKVLTKFGATRWRIDWDTLTCVFSRWRSPPPWILPKVEFWATVTVIWSVFIRLPNLTQIPSLMTEMLSKIQIHDGGCHHLEFYPNLDMGHSNPRMGIVYVHTKFDATIFIGHLNMTKKPNPQWQLPPSWFSDECYFGPSVALIWPIWSNTPSLAQIVQELARPRYT